MNELISVIINVYNGEKYITKCLDSIINQTYTNLEILIINDGSTDGTLEICNSYKDERIRIITTENQGLALSRNTGLDNAKGEYFYFVDADDFIASDTIEYLYSLIKKYDIKIATCRPLEIHDYNFTVAQEIEKIEVISAEDMIKKILLWKEYSVSTWNKLVKRDLYANLRFKNRIINDMDFSHKLITKTDRIVYSNQIKYYYLLRNDSLCHKENSVERLIDMYNVFVDRYNYINELYPNMAENAASFLQSTINLYYSKTTKVREYMHKKSALKLYKKAFTLKILKTDIGLREKIKIILFRLPFPLYKFIIDTYLKLKKVICK
jgi:glycosyltransferase involved in cell wall biosynthesis